MMLWGQNGQIRGPKWRLGAEKMVVLERRNSQTWGKIPIIHLCLCYCGVKMTILGGLNVMLAQRKW